MSAVNVVSSTQRIIVNGPNDEVSIINAGPQGPAGVPGVGSGGMGIPNGGSINQILTKNSSTNQDVSWTNSGGFTYVTDTQPTPTKVGETWFDLSTANTGGTSWVAIEESPGGEKVWVQFSPIGTSKLLASGVLTYGQVYTSSSVRNSFSSSTSNDASAVTLDNSGIITVKRSSNYFITLHYATTIGSAVAGAYYHTQMYGAGGTVAAEAVQSAAQPYGTLNITVAQYNVPVNTTYYVMSYTAGGPSVSVRIGQLIVQEI